MADSKLRDLSTDFAVKVIKLCDGIKGHYCGWMIYTPYGMIVMRECKKLLNYFSKYNIILSNRVIVWLACKILKENSK